MTWNETRLAAAIVAMPLMLPALAYGQAAMPNCNDATMFPNPIVLAGSSAIEPTVSRIAIRIAAKNTIIFKSTASCDGHNAIKGETVLTGNANFYKPDATDPKKVVIATCSLDAAPTKADLGVSDVSYDACIGEALPATIGQFTGPVQSMLLVVPEANVTTTAMSAEQAQVLWGCGMKGAVGAFTDELAIQQRNSQSGTQIMISKYISVPADQFKGVPNASTGNLVTSLLAVPDKQKAIGFVAADAYETRRAMLNSLAFKGFGQTKAYYPDSDANATDKKNVRDGHYVIQGPLRLVTKVGGDGKPTSAAASALIDWLTGAAEIEAGNPKAYIDIVAGIGNVPQCAMKVKRDIDGGYFQPYTAPKACGCYFEQAATGKPPTTATCKVCATDAECGAMKCNYGFCE